MESKPSISIIGRGAVGSALVDFFRRSEYPLWSVWGHRKEECFLMSDDKEIQTENSFPQTSSDLGEIIFIAVPDDKIAEVADQLSNQKIDWSLHSVVHLSGAKSSDLLSSIKEKGGATASMHPLQTFTKGDGSDRFKDIYISLEGDEELVEKLEGIVSDFGALSFKLTPDQKRSMHIAAVFASNYLVSLMDIVHQITSKNGIENGLQILAPIIRQTFSNIEEKGIEQSLSGPVKRGDLNTIKQHLSDLDDAPELTKNLYKKLGLQALNITQKSAQLTPEQVKELKDLLDL
ncbi:MAG: DUF2520 domain-containing protein [Balneolaceae bacterium]